MITEKPLSPCNDNRVSASTGDLSDLTMNTARKSGQYCVLSRQARQSPSSLVAGLEIYECLRAQIAAHVLLFSAIYSHYADSHSSSILNSLRNELKSAINSTDFPEAEVKYHRANAPAGSRHNKPLSSPDTRFLNGSISSADGSQASVESDSL